jgi:signal transduction histidine kinase
LLFVPLVARDRAIGELVLLRRSGRDAFDDADVTLGEGLADRAAAAIDNARLYAASLEATRLRDDVLGVVSHDLRGPLNGISLTARLIARRHPDEPGPRAILDAVALANQLLGDLLLAGKLESGTFAVHPQPESVPEIVDEVLALARPEAGDRAIELWTSVDADVAEAWVDRLRMLQLVGNLVSNALKFTPRGGRVGIRVRRAGEQVEVAVSDTGPGIPPDQIPHLFDRFWQGAQARSADAGLGLSIAKGIAEAHGGDIRVESELGHGATFIVTLPLQGQTADSNAVAS